MQCRVHVGQLGRLYEEFKAANTDVLVILGDTPERARKYAESLSTPFPVLAVVERTVYHQFGLDKAWLIMQRTASIIVDRAGIIRYFKPATNPMIWLQESRELLRAAQQLAETQMTKG